MTRSSSSDPVTSGVMAPSPMPPSVVTKKLLQIGLTSLVLSLVCTIILSQTLHGGVTPHVLLMAMILPCMVLPIAGFMVWRLAIAWQMSQQQVKQSSVKDHLTQTYQHDYLLERGEVEFDKAQRHQLGLSIIVLDIDNFKKINHDYGQSSGDLVLRNLADAIMPRLRSQDLLARFGKAGDSDSFALLLPHTDTAAACLVAERLCEMTPTLEVQNANGQKIHITISVGVTSLTTETESFEALLDHAQAALYRAKLSGKNRVVSEVASHNLSLPLTEALIS